MNQAISLFIPIEHVYRTQSGARIIGISPQANKVQARTNVVKKAFYWVLKGSRVIWKQHVSRIMWLKKGCKRSHQQEVKSLDLFQDRNRTLLRFQRLFLLPIGQGYVAYRYS